MNIIYSADKEISKGDYNADVDADGTLVLPASFRPLNEQCGARSAETFFSICMDCPSALMQHCGWTQQETAAANARLKDQLRGHISDKLLDYDATKRRSYPFGAQRPGSKPKP